MSESVNLTIDGKKITVPTGTTVFTAASQLQIPIPVFCYQDRMPPFGACRVCLVEVEKMQKPQTSCTLHATEGMVVHTQSAIADRGRKEILEFLLINHPLDCPICDRGGECPLQEHTMNYGPGKSHFYEDKRHFKKPYPLGPVLMLDRERCIICARCTRFGDIIAGDHALEFIERGFKTEVGTADGGPPKSKFIGNTIMICPVGALTSQVYRFKARPWDNSATPSTCTLCPVGCSFVINSRDGEITRTIAKEDRQVNDIWLCDKGWFGYEFASDPDRLRTPLIRHNNRLLPASWDEALQLIAEKMLEAKSSGKIAAFGGNPLTTEENFLFQKLLRTGAGVNHVDHRIGMPIFNKDEEGMLPGMGLSLQDCENVETALLLGFDITEQFPLLWLRLHQAIHKGAKSYFFGHYLPEIASHLAKSVLHKPGTEIQIIKEQLPGILQSNAKCSIFVGTQYLHSKNRKAILAELLQLKTQHPNLTINVMEGSNNSLGASLAGMRPDLGPLNSELENPGLNALQVLENAANDRWDVLYVVGANPVRKFPSELWKKARNNLSFLVVQDLFMTETAAQADVVLPTLCFFEKSGTFLNIEKRVRRLLPGKDIPIDIFSDEEIFIHLAKKMNIDLSLDLNFMKSLKQMLHTTPEVQFDHESHLKVSANTNDKGKLLATFVPKLFDDGIRMKHNPHLIQLAQQPKVCLHPKDASTRGIQTTDSIKISCKDNSITTQAKVDSGIAEGTILIPLGFDTLPAHELANNLLNGLEVEVSLA